MKSITQDTSQMEYPTTKTQQFFKRYRVGQLLRASNANKLKGIAVTQIFLYAVSIIFLGRTLFMQMHLHQETLPFAKDTFYRFMGSCRVNWRKFTMSLAGSIIRETIGPLTSANRTNVLIIDDSFYSRARSKKVELLAKVYDHAHGVYAFGFRMLTLAWSDGNTILPLDHCLLSTSNREALVNGAATSVDQRTNGGKQRKLAQAKATDVAMRMPGAAKAARIPARHILFDSWFCFPKTLVAIKGMAFDVIAMAKKTSKIHYICQGKSQDVMSIYRQNKKRRGRSKYLLSVEAGARSGKASIPVRLVFVRDRDNRKDYRVLVTTDMELTPEEVIRLYGKRWGIEIFFKVCKSYLRLAKECRATSYDAMTAHVAVVFTRYMLLAVEQREAQDPRSLGELFYQSVDELRDIQYLEALCLLLSLFVSVARNYLPEDSIRCLLDRFMDSLPESLATALRKCA